MKKYLLISLLTLSGCTLTEKNIHDPMAKQYLDQAIHFYQMKDYAQARVDFLKADERGHMKAPRYLGLMTLNGEGVAKDEKQAFAYFQKAADKGDITSQYWLGYLYENGIGTERNLTQAVKFYRLSAKRGDHISQPAIDTLKRLGVSK